MWRSYGRSLGSSEINQQNEGRPYCAMASKGLVHIGENPSAQTFVLLRKRILVCLIYYFTSIPIAYIPGDMSIAVDWDVNNAKSIKRTKNIFRKSTSIEFCLCVTMPFEEFQVCEFKQCFLDSWNACIPAVQIFKGDAGTISFIVYASARRLF